MENVAAPAYQRLVELAYGIADEPAIRTLQERCPDAWAQIMAASDALFGASVLVSMQRDRIDQQGMPVRPS